MVATEKVGRTALAVLLACVLGGTTATSASASDKVGTAAPHASLGDGVLPAQDAESRTIPIFGIVAAAATVGGSIYGAGQWAGERMFHAGLRRAEYQRVKWQVRSAAVGVFSLAGAPIFMTGFENKFYSLS